MSAAVAPHLSITQLLEREDLHLPTSADLQPLFVDCGIRRGSTLRITYFPGATSLVMRLLVEPLRAGSWAAVVGVPGLGAESASSLGIPLDRLALVPDPGTEWLEATAALLDSMDLVALAPPGRCRATDARKLAARARQRRSVLIICPSHVSPSHAVSPPHVSPSHAVSPPHSASMSAASPLWPESADVDLIGVDTEWLGLRAGRGRLRSRNLTITASGRRLPGRGRQIQISLAG